MSGISTTLFIIKLGIYNKKNAPLGFHALRMIRRSVGFSLIFLIHSRS